MASTFSEVMSTEEFAKGLGKYMEQGLALQERVAKQANPQINAILRTYNLLFSHTCIGVSELMRSNMPTLTGKQRCGRCRIHGSGEIQGTVDIGGAGTAAAIDPKRPAFGSGNHSGAHLAPD